MFHTLLDPGANNGVGVAFTDRHDGVTPLPRGSLDLGDAPGTDPALTAANAALVREALGLDELVLVRQVHGTDVLVIDRGGVRHGVADGLVTTRTRVGLAVRVADCLPVLFADTAARVIGAAHAGRVGLAAGVLEETVAAMRRLGATTITAWVGPSICGRCYEVPEQMRADVAARIPQTWSRSREGTPSLDLAAGAHAILERLGCVTVDVGGCTRESADLHSFRRDGADAGRMAGICWLG